MALKIFWTIQAYNGLKKVINFLEENWSAKEILNLEIKLNSFLFRIKKHPNLYPYTSKIKNLRKGLIDKNNYIIYRINFKKS